MRVSLSENISKILCLEPNLCMGSTVVCTTRTDIVFFCVYCQLPTSISLQSGLHVGGQIGTVCMDHNPWQFSAHLLVQDWQAASRSAGMERPLEKGSRCWNFSHSRSSACSFLKTNQNKVLNDEAKPKPLAQELIGQCGSFESDRDGFHSNATKTYQVFPNLPAGASICNLDIGEICWYWWICWWLWTCCVLVSPTLDNPTWLSYFGIRSE